MKGFHDREFVPHKPTAKAAGMIQSGSYMYGYTDALTETNWQPEVQLQDQTCNKQGDDY